MVEAKLFQQVPHLIDVITIRNRKTKIKTGKPIFPFVIFVVLLIFATIIYGSYQNTKEPKNINITEQYKKLSEDIRLQNFINKIYAGKELSGFEQSDFCELLQKLKNIYVNNCGKLSSQELKKLLFLNSIKYKATVGYSSSVNYRKIFFNINPDLKGEVVVHHAIEQDIINKYPGLFTLSEIHSIENLRGIPKNKNSLLHLSKIRRIWNEFYRQYANPSRQDILDKATEVDNMFASQFKPTI